MCILRQVVNMKFESLALCKHTTLFSPVAYWKYPQMVLDGIVILVMEGFWLSSSPSCGHVLSMCGLQNE